MWDTPENSVRAQQKVDAVLNGCSVELAATLDGVVVANTTNAVVLVEGALAVIVYHPLMRIEEVILMTSWRWKT